MCKINANAQNSDICENSHILHISSEDQVLHQGLEHDVPEALRNEPRVFWDVDSIVDIPGKSVAQESNVLAPPEASENGDSNGEKVSENVKIGSKHRFYMWFK